MDSNSAGQAAVDVDLTDSTDWKSRALAAEALLIAMERTGRIGLRMHREEYPDAS